MSTARKELAIKAIEKVWEEVVGGDAKPPRSGEVENFYQKLFRSIKKDRSKKHLSELPEYLIIHESKLIGNPHPVECLLLFVYINEVRKQVNAAQIPEHANFDSLLSQSPQLAKIKEIQKPLHPVIMSDKNLGFKSKIRNKYDCNLFQAYRALMEKQKRITLERLPTTLQKEAKQLSETLISDIDTFTSYLVLEERYDAFSICASAFRRRVARYAAFVWIYENILYPLGEKVMKADSIKYSIPFSHDVELLLAERYGGELFQGGVISKFIKKIYDSFQPSIAQHGAQAKLDRELDAMERDSIIQIPDHIAFYYYSDFPLVEVKALPPSAPPAPASVFVGEVEGEEQVEGLPEPSAPVEVTLPAPSAPPLVEEGEVELESEEPGAPDWAAAAPVKAESSGLRDRVRELEAPVYPRSHESDLRAHSMYQPVVDVDPSPAIGETGEFSAGSSIKERAVLLS